MRSIMLGIWVFTLFLGIAALSTAKEAKEKEPEKDFFIMGEVTAYNPGKSITVKDEDGKSHTFEIYEDTYLHGDIRKGSNVEIIAVGKKVEYIILIEEEEEEEDELPLEETPKE